MGATIWFVPVIMVPMINCSDPPQALFWLPQLVLAGTRPGLLTWASTQLGREHVCLA